MRILHSCLAGFSITAACSGAEISPLADAGAETSVDARHDGAPDVTPANEDAGAPVTSAPCPDQAGGYKLSLGGPGCGDTSSFVSQCIKQTGCTIAIGFSGGSAGKGVKCTSAVLAADGSFSNETVQEGSVWRTGCTASWSEAKSTLVIGCGIDATSCVATLERVSAACP